MVGDDASLIKAALWRPMGVLSDFEYNSVCLAVTMTAARGTWVVDADILDAVREVPDGY